MNELKDKINNIIFHLMAVNCTNQDIHYTAHGEAFYAIHTFVEKFNFEDDIDLIKESILLGNGIRPLSSADYLVGVINLLKPAKENDNKGNFENLRELLIETNNIISSARVSIIEDTILTDIGKKVLQYIGLVNLQLED